MFGFIRDITLELQGVDVESAKKERDEKREQEKLSRYIFTKGAKRAVIILGLSYAPLALLNTWMIISDASYFNADFAFQLMRNLILILLSTGVCVALFTGNKKAEIFALIGSGMFVILLYVFFIILR